MKTITKYKADDGCEFTDAGECAAHEDYSRRVKAIVAQLPARPDGNDFTNGHGYIQHDEETFWRVREEVLRIAQETCSHHWIQDAIDKRSVHPSYPFRIISESSNRALYDAWLRFSCTDDALREWGQPYYRDHSAEAEQTCLNP